MKFIKVLAMLMVGFSLVQCNDKAKPKKDNEDQKIIYALAYDMGKKLQAFDLSKTEAKVLNQGIADGLNNKEAAVDVKKEVVKIRTLVEKRSKKVQAKEQDAAKGFLAKMSAEKGATTMESGLIYIPLKEGEGESPKATDKVKVHYHGTLRDGEVFDSSKDRGQPAEFRLNGVIKCWTEGVQKMKVGGKAILGCPSEIAYPNGAPPAIMPGAALKFEVELLEIVKEDKKEDKKK